MAFLEQEMLDFTSSIEQDMLDEDVESGQGFSADGDEGFDGQQEDGDDEFEFSSSSEAGSLGDIRVFAKDDDEEEEDEEELKKKRAMRKRMRKAWSKTKGAPSAKARSTTFESISGDEGDIDGASLILTAWTIDDSTQLDKAKGRKLQRNSNGGSGRTSGTNRRGERTRGNTNYDNAVIDGDRNQERENYRGNSEDVDDTDSVEGEVEFICDVKTDTERSENSDNSDICFDPAVYCPATIDQFAAQTYTVNTDSAITLT